MRSSNNNNNFSQCKGQTAEEANPKRRKTSTGEANPKRRKSSTPQKITDDNLQENITDFYQNLGEGDTKENILHTGRFEVSCYVRTICY